MHSNRQSQFWLILFPAGPSSSWPASDPTIILSKELHKADLLMERRNSKIPGITSNDAEVKLPCFLVCDDGVGCIFASLLKPSRLPLIASKASSRLFSPVWVRTSRVFRAQRVAQMRAEHARKMIKWTGWVEKLTLGLTLLRSLSFCFCSSNCLLFLSSSSIFCCCSRRFLKGQDEYRHYIESWVNNILEQVRNGARQWHTQFSVYRQTDVKRPKLKNWRVSRADCALGKYRGKTVCNFTISKINGVEKLWKGGSSKAVGPFVSQYWVLLTK